MINPGFSKEDFLATIRKDFLHLDPRGLLSVVTVLPRAIREGLPLEDICIHLCFINAVWVGKTNKKKWVTRRKIKFNV